MAVVRLSKRAWEQLRSKEFRSYLTRLVEQMLVPNDFRKKKRGHEIYSVESRHV